MKKVINGKIYNTATAKEIASASSDCGKSDFRYFHETLMKTQKGRFFLVGEGGPMTRWAKNNGMDGVWASSGLQAIDMANALEWCEKHGVNADIIAEHFEIEDA